MLMQHLLTLFLFIHIIAGACALLLFWLPAWLKKGSPNHIRFGRYYVNAMYTVAASGFFMAMLVMIDPLGLQRNLVVDNANPDHQIMVIRSTRGFLLYLSLLTLASIRHGVLVLRHKTERQALKKPSHLLLTAGLAGFGPILAIWGYTQQMTLLIIFGILGLLLGSGMLRYTFRSTLSKNQWWIEHLGAMIGSGIAAHTAFFVFGMARFFEVDSTLRLLSWILPGIIGGIAINYLSRFYQRKFG